LIQRNQHGGLPVRFQDRQAALRLWRNCHAQNVHQIHCAHRDAAAPIFGGHAAAGQHLEILRFGQGFVTRGLGQNRARQRVLGERFGDTRPAQHFALLGIPTAPAAVRLSIRASENGNRFQHLDIDQARLAFGERASFIQRHGADLTGVFKVLTALDQDALFGGAADTRHNRDRRGNHQRARAADHQQRQRKLNVTRDNEGADAQYDDEGRVPTGEALDEALRGRLFVLGFFDARDDARQSGVGADTGGAHF